MTTQRDENDPVGTPGSPPRTASGGYQVGSEEPPCSAEVPGSGSSDEDDRVDPFVAFAQSAAEDRERKKRERDPGIWLPGSDDLDQERSLPDRETRFSRDSYGGRGNPQVSVRLRPLDFDRLRRAAELYGVRPTTLARMMVIRGVGAILDADLHRDGELLRDRGRR